MIKILNMIAWASLGLLVIPSCFYLAGQVELKSVHFLMGIATVIWFGSKILITYLQTKVTG